VSAAAVRFEDLEVGSEAPVLDHILSRTDLVVYAGASGDFNPMHHDEVLAQAAGMPSVFGHGMFSMGLLGTALTNWLGAGTITRYRVRFSKQTWPGETLRTRVVVTATREEGGRRLVDLECGLANSAGEVKVLGEATADLTAGETSEA
jgi:acyl dehydratase